ncbi:intracellular coagulation inhibitor 1 isoform X1 [Tribolium castaneum]|nr:PREDICTED: antichymotrypsin-2 isoform X1 [Tribolium castaneum]|eukprot:XP_008196889.1 PREDICTED: antichymotrypsin-2 isoform X1 [Tribolium castaneum]
MCFVLFLLFGGAFASNATQKYDKRFTASLYKEVGKNCTNFVISPFLIETAFGALYLGSSGRTSQEMRIVFHFPVSNEELETRYRNFFANFTNQGYRLHIANKVSVVDRVKFVPSWEKKIKDIFQVCTDIVDLRNKDRTVAKINRWFGEQTYKKIDILSREMLSCERIDVLLLSALYFQANWAQPFSSDCTREGIFYNYGREQIFVDMMNTRAQLINYGKSIKLKAQFLELLFEQNQASMVVVVPNERDGISKLEKNITNVLYFRKFRPQLMTILLPKFRMENTLDLEEFIHKLGLNVTFNEQKASLFGTVTCANCPSPYVTKVSQKIYLDVNERGVQAEAGQVVQYMAPKFLYPELKVDHPFIFYIKVREVVVFVGRVVAF